MVNTARLPGRGSDAWWREPQKRTAQVAADLAALRRTVNRPGPIATADQSYGDGATDATAHLQATFDRVHAAGGGTVIIPPGTYLVSSQITMPANAHIFGHGATLLRDSETVHMLVNWEPGDTTTWGYTGRSNITAEGLTIDGREGESGFAWSGTYSQLMTFQSCRNITVRDCRFMRNCMYHQLELNAVDGALVENCSFEGTNPLDNLYREHLQIDQASPGNAGAADGTISKNITVRSCVFSGSDTLGMHAAGVGSHTATGGAQYENIHIDSCTFIGVWRMAVRAYHWVDSRITNCYSLSYGPVYAHHLIDQCHRTVISGNTVRGSSGAIVEAANAGINLQGGTNLAATDNAVSALTDGIVGTAAQGTISGNVIEDMARYAISYAGSHTLMSGNHMSATSSSPIRLYGGATSDGVGITGNVYRPDGRPAAAAAVSIASGHTNVWVYGNDFMGATAVTNGTINTTVNRI